MRLARLPFIEWSKTYNKATFTGDISAGVIVAIMLVPQSLAYAMLAGLPPEVGLYASLLPLIIYAVFGTSRTLAVGPVAIVSLMTASAVGQVAAQGTADYLAAAAGLALLSGGILMLLGFLRLGFLANFLSHPVISGFVTATALLIAAGQIQHFLGTRSRGDTLPGIFLSLAGGLSGINWGTLSVGLGVLAFLVFARKQLARVLITLGVPTQAAGTIAKTSPLIAIAMTVLLSHALDLQAHGVALVGSVPQGLPALSIPYLPLDLVGALLLPAFLISIIGFVESMSVAQTLAVKRRQRVEPNQELIALGAANIGAGISSGYPVTGGIARSAVNFDAGAQTPAAGVFAAIGIATVTMFMTPALQSLPQATLAATIVVAVLSLVDFGIIRRVFAYSKADFIAMMTTILITLGYGVELGIGAGVVLSLLLHLHRTSKPHTAIVGQVPGTEHYRNVERHDVLVHPRILSIRVDESLYFANARFLEDRIATLVAERANLDHVILMCSAVNLIDASAMESLEEINRRLGDAGVGFHLSEVKGPVLDGIRTTNFLEHLNGRVFLSQHEAVSYLVGQRSA